MADRIDLGEVPFYWRTKPDPVHPPLDIPSRLPFSFSFVDSLQLLVQQKRPDVLRWLDRIYTEDANVGYLQDGHALAQSYGGEFLDFFARAALKLPRKPASAADIGCGGIYLLQQLRAAGLSVKGIDPSPVTSAAGRKAGIDIVPDFYPSPSLTERFDVLFHYDVLEHVENPVEFLRAHHSNLTEGGGLIFAVPDCTHHIRLGDVSMVLHEHLNYFDEESLAIVVRAAGFDPILLEPAHHGGVLLCCAIPATVSTPSVSSGHRKFDEFCLRAETTLSRFCGFAGDSCEGELGLYVPLRAFPYLGRLSTTKSLRFFDDDPGLHGRYYDGFTVPVENRADLIANPPTQTIICSLAFGDRIAERLPASVRVAKWTDLFSKEST